MGEQKVSDVINTQLQFKAILSKGLWGVHYPCIVDQDMELILLFFETV